VKHAQLLERDKHSLLKQPTQWLNIQMMILEMLITEAL